LKGKNSNGDGFKGWEKGYKRQLTNLQGQRPQKKQRNRRTTRKISKKEKTEVK